MFDWPARMKTFKGPFFAWSAMAGAASSSTAIAVRLKIALVRGPWFALAVPFAETSSLSFHKDTTVCPSLNN